MINEDELLVCMCLMEKKQTDNIYFTEGGIILCDTCYRIYKDLPLSMVSGDLTLHVAGCSLLDAMEMLDSYRELYDDDLDLAKHLLFVPNLRAVEEVLRDDH